MTRYISGRALGLIVLVTFCCSINASSFTSVCGDCVYKGGAGFVKHPTICDAFYECDNTTGKYTLLRCPSGMTWNHDIWSCVVDQSCTYPTSPTTTPNPCLVNSVDTANPAGFLVTANGNVFNMNCAPGTLYNATSCKCDITTTTTRGPPACTEELYLPCNVDISDHSGNWLWVANTNVTLATVPRRSYKACSFDGSADLSVPFFKNNDLGDNWTIRFNYRSQTGSTGVRVLVSNSVCNSISPTLEVTHAQDRVCVNIETNSNNFTLCSANTGIPTPNLPFCR
ncbi:protein PIF-like [Haliotis rubra]|uniref:protein PIF-like n=1 Tax=Haliotis rubra TaxID=36100 RepID=UPI001EE519B4|nr:protein PIF-like [Haliotis rubra]